MGEEKQNKHKPFMSILNANANPLNIWEVKVMRWFIPQLWHRRHRVHLISLWFCVREYDESITYLMCVDLEPVTSASSSHSGYLCHGVEEDEALQSLIWNGTGMLNTSWQSWTAS